MNFLSSAWNLVFDAWSSIVGLFWGKEATLCVFGLDNAGKTTLLGRLSTGILKSSTETRHPNMYELVLGSLTIKAFDLAGQVARRRVWEQYFPILDGIIFMVDASDPSRFPEAKEELYKLMMTPELVKVPILVLGNKIDLPSSVPEQHLRDALQINVTTGKSERKVTDVRAMEVFMCSIVQSQGYGHAMKWLAAQV